MICTKNVINEMSFSMLVCHINFLAPQVSTAATVSQNNFVHALNSTKVLGPLC